VIDARINGVRPPRSCTKNSEVSRAAFPIVALGLFLRRASATCKISLGCELGEDAALPRLRDACPCTHDCSAPCDPCTCNSGIAFADPTHVWHKDSCQITGGAKGPQSLWRLFVAEGYDCRAAAGSETLPLLQLDRSMASSKPKWSLLLSSPGKTLLSRSWRCPLPRISRNR